MKGDYLKLGIVIGVAVTLVGHFATQSSSRPATELFLFWLALGLGVGFLISFALERSSLRAEEAASEEGMTRTSTGELKAVIPTSSKFYAVSRKPSSSELRALMVDAGAVPGTPISTRLQLIVERYDAYSCQRLSEGSLLDYPVWEIAQRVLDEAMDRMPATTTDVDLELVALYSSGPLTERGRSPFGWSFELIDGACGIHCTAILTDSDMLLLYGTAVSYPRGAKLEWMPASRAKMLVEEAFPEAKGLDLYLQVRLPDEYYLVSLAPLALFGIDLASSRLSAPALLPPLKPSADEVTAFTVADLLSVLDSETASPLKERLSSQNRQALEATARDLLRQQGPRVVQELASAAERFDALEESVSRILLHVLSLVPNRLATLALYRLSEVLTSENEGLAFSLFEKRRHGELNLDPDPLNGLSFEEVRALLGKTDRRQVALRSTYEPEGDLIPELARIGLIQRHVRLLSGDTELFLSAQFITADLRTEALLSSSPLPVPCHILRLVGPEAQHIEEQLRTSGINYTNEQIISDVLSGRPYDVHRGALYQAAMEVDAHETFEALIDAASRHRTNIELRRATLAALAQLSCDGVNEFLLSIDDPNLLDLARLLLTRRGVALPETPDRKRTPSGGMMAVEDVS